MSLHSSRLHVGAAAAHVACGRRVPSMETVCDGGADGACTSRPRNSMCVCGAVRGAGVGRQGEDEAVSARRL
eukprot:3863017-Rhodomonas_salina.2